jgi:hypothetical protein
VALAPRARRNVCGPAPTAARAFCPPSRSSRRCSSCVSPGLAASFRPCEPSFAGGDSLHGHLQRRVASPRSGPRVALEQIEVTPVSRRLGPVGGGLAVLHWIRHCYLVLSALCCVAHEGKRPKNQSSACPLSLEGDWRAVRDLAARGPGGAEKRDDRAGHERRSVRVRGCAQGVFDCILIQRCASREAAAGIGGPGATTPVGR